MEISAMILANVWSETIWPVLMLVFGFGGVIFFHELGHFMACKIVGIKVERFAIGFGPRLCGIHRGDTDYCINILPVGGYIKMLGQEDFKPLDEEQGAGDPGSFGNKSIGARMFVVSAGVIMNIILAAILFIAVCLAGIRFMAPIAGGAVPDSPAAKAVITWHDATGAKTSTQPTTTVGLEPGDEIAELDGQKLTRFRRILVKAAMANLDDRYAMTIRRQVDGQTWTGTTEMGVMPDPRDPLKKIFGIKMTHDTLVGESEGTKTKTPFTKGDRVTAINSQPIAYHWDIEPLEKTLSGSDVTVTILRGEEKIDVVVRPESRVDKVMFLPDGTVLHIGSSKPVDDGKSYELKLADGSDRTVKADELKAEMLDVLGMIPRVRVMTVTNDSPADKTGLKPDDVIISYADRGAPTLSVLHALNRKFAGEETNVIVLRDGKTLPRMSIKPKNRNGGALIGIAPAVDVDNTVVAGVRKGSLADSAGLQAGDVIQQINGSDVKTWNDIVATRRAITSGVVTITYMRGSVSNTATTSDIANAQIKPDDYHFYLFEGRVPFMLLLGNEIKETNPLAALSWGATETYDFVVMTYATLRGLIMRTVSPSELRGPVGIVDIGIKVGSKSAVELVYLLAMISVSLAVINFLPIPVVDGGMALFLVIEKIRGKPLSLKLMNIIQMVGIVLLIGVFLYVTYADIARIWNRTW